MSLGFERAGFEVVHAFDNWQHAVDTSAANMDRPGDSAPIEQARPLTTARARGGADVPRPTTSSADPLQRESR